MSYHFSKTISLPMDKAVEHVTTALAAKGFGVLTTIDIGATLKKKLDVEFRPYVILGACNPGFAYKALQHESHIGTMLPCNVILQQVGEGRIEVSAVDPIASMQGVGNPDLASIAGDVRDLLKEVVEGL
jgi:uncharacterized protein (DUF302 family)